MHRPKYLMQLTDDKEMHVIPEAGHFDMYDLEPYVSEAFE